MILGLWIVHSLVLAMTVTTRTTTTTTGVDALNYAWCSSTPKPQPTELSPRLWLESLPNGAYTVVRCDRHCNTHSWSIWGREYHLQRLRDSYVCAFGKAASLQVAHDETQRVWDGLLGHAAAAWKTLLEDDEHASTATACMVTLLLCPDGVNGVIRVYGHVSRSAVMTTGTSISATATSSGAGLPFSNYNPKPLTLGLAHPNCTTNRQPHPQAKLSKWCHERRSIERVFCTDVVDEVILTKEQLAYTTDGSGGASRRPQLLEGLTTNLFVVDSQGIVRTCSDTEVLAGYARHLVLQHAEAADTSTPIFGDNMDDWVQVFVTSSFRLLVPVERIVHQNGTVLWADSATDGDDDERMWKQLYQRILEAQYSDDAQ